MPVYLGLGALVLGLSLLLLRAFLNSNPAKLARSAQLFVIVAGGAALLVLVAFLALERTSLALAVVGGLTPLRARAFAQWRRRQAASAPPQGQSSEIETDYLPMHLDHGTGAMRGTVRRGRVQGRDLATLSREELVALWHECRLEDAQGAKLLEAYLDRLMPGWRAAGRAEDAKPSRASGGMSREEAYAILGLAADAGEAEIREAYQRLMLKNHPDRGGSSYLAAQINRAREVLLG